MNPTGIEYLDYTWNPTHGCTPVSPGCAGCWAKRTAETRLRGRCGYPANRPFSVVVCDADRLAEPLRVKTPARIGVSFMGDLFHPAVPFAFMKTVFTVMRACPKHTFMLLTKRPGRMAYFANIYWPAAGSMGKEPAVWPFNVWAGTSVESQKYAPRLDVLARVPAAVRFVSAEPLLEPLDLLPWLPDPHHDRCLAWDVPGHSHGGVLDWVIAGCESGPKRRPFREDWVRSLRDQCQAGGIPLFYKQGVPDGSTKVVHLPLLDGVQHREAPA